MKSLGVAGIIVEMQRAGQQKHCCDRGFGVFEVKLQQISEVNLRESL